MATDDLNIRWTENAQYKQKTTRKNRFYDVNYKNIFQDLKQTTITGEILP